MEKKVRGRRPYASRKRERTEVIAIRLTKAEKEKVEKAAWDDDRSIAEFGRKILLAGVQK